MGLPDGCGRYQELEVDHISDLWWKGLKREGSAAWRTRGIGAREGRKELARGIFARHLQAGRRQYFGLPSSILEVPICASLASWSVDVVCSGASSRFRRSWYSNWGTDSKLCVFGCAGAAKDRSSIDD